MVFGRTGGGTVHHSVYKFRSHNGAYDERFGFGDIDAMVDRATNDNRRWQD